VTVSESERASRCSFSVVALDFPCAVNFATGANGNRSGYVAVSGTLVWDREISETIAVSILVTRHGSRKFSVAGKPNWCRHAQQTMPPRSAARFFIPDGRIDRVVLMRPRDDGYGLVERKQRLCGWWSRPWDEVSGALQFDGTERLRRVPSVTA
jgi:hypothetical protein